MMKYRVEGRTEVFIDVIVEAESEDEAIDMAMDEITCLSSYVGNFGYDKLVGVSDSNHSVSASEEIEWEQAIPLDEEDAQ